MTMKNMQNSISYIGLCKMTKISKILVQRILDYTFLLVTFYLIVKQMLQVNISVFKTPGNQLGVQKDYNTGNIIYNIFLFLPLFC